MTQQPHLPAKLLAIIEVSPSEKVRCGRPGCKHTVYKAVHVVRDAGQLTTGQKIMGYPTLLLGLVLDFALNVVLCTLIFIELPREWTVSARLWRHSTQGSGWRKKAALLVRTQLLDTADPRGYHSG